MANRGNLVGSGGRFRKLTAAVAAGAALAGGSLASVVGSVVSAPPAAAGGGRIYGDYHDGPPYCQTFLVGVNVAAVKITVVGDAGDNGGDNGHGGGVGGRGGGVTGTIPVAYTDTLYVHVGRIGSWAAGLAARPG